MYGAPKKSDSIDKYRYLSLMKNTRNNKRVQLSCLPPTSAAAYQHLCCVYYQVQVWLGNELHPEDWEWVLKDNSLEPIQTLIPPAPEKPLNTIFVIARRVLIIIAAVKKSDCFVHNYVVIAKASLTPMLNQIQQMKLPVISMKRYLMHLFSQSNLWKSSNKGKKKKAKNNIDFLDDS
ncbi:hypothetical protein AVEN_274272-1 [Araneus ventricosus]|uniref:Uncharacterized protein n=1 Tax=Araneus ventricosus TaxID=182803 RepID=A0A4Y2LDU1_ARAVE|nr:hypothetical protein AVEN_274272-1 [Araneus ventricosus]